ncbi:MAG: branched-chain amino acid ABC transporter permease [Actinobacteria bacterium]|nr:branched-chain amino acid ABC transporter permease [Actinomycetota bacterium]
MKTVEEAPLLVEERDLARPLNLALAALGIVAAVMFALQPVLPGTSLVFWFNLMKAIVLALSLNLITGYTGYVDFGHVVFYGLGTYVAGIAIGMLGIALPLPLWVFVGPLLVAVIAVVVGLPALRLRGAYFAIAMLSFNAATRLIVLNLPRDFAGGAFGIPSPEIYDPRAAYYGMVGLLVAIVLVTVWLGHSRFGVGLKAIRDDEIAAGAMGVRTTRYKLAAFAASAYFAGAAGSVDYWFVAFTSNELVFSNVQTVEMVAGVFLGGAGTVVGPILGAGTLYLVRDFLWARFPFLYLPMFGLVIAAVVLWVPRGVVGFVEDRVPSLRAKFK